MAKKINCNICKCQTCKFLDKGFCMKYHIGICEQCLIEVDRCKNYVGGKIQ